MAINLDSTQGAPAATAARLDRHDPDARQDRWMLELERAMFSTSAKKPRGAHGGQTVAAQQENVCPDLAEAAPPPGQRPAGLPQRPAGGVRGVDSQLGGAAASAKRTGLQTARDAVADRNEDAKAAAGPVAVAAVVPAFAHAPAGVQTAAAFTAIGGAAAVASAVHSVPRVAASSDLIGSVQNVQAARQIAVPTLALSQSAAPASEASMPAEAALDSVERPASDAAGSADAVEFDKRVMHMFAGTDGMHAYIRDAELGAAQMRSVAAALSSELALGGQSLATLTVNGKRIGLTKKDAPGGAFDADGMASAAGDEPAGARPYSYSLTHARKDSSE
jgi:hypothetical protein